MHKNVVILGGGASGTCAAVRLREDYGKGVLLVEMEPILVSIFTNSFLNKHDLIMMISNTEQGGHTNTYIIPSTSEAFNNGV